ncbi:N-acetylglucosamine kinase [Flexivirga alba]|uniref:N-acetylglucosamine kinase n=1 Tax=Flexivirga alba TaxID=702742 RepID=A0ABW2ALJ1_9MICO
MSLFLTVDAGGTSTRALVHDAEGTCSGYAVAGGGNPTASGVESVANAMRSAATEALGQAGAGPGEIGHALAAMAGSAVGLTGVERGLQQLGVGATLHLGSDLEAMFFAGTAQLSGAALVSGTGAAAIVVHDGVTTARGDGRGWLLGDDGSGYWIARRVVRAVTADLDGRGPQTSLTDVLLPAAGVTGDRAADKDVLLDQLVANLYAIPTPGIARFAPLAFDHADIDDVARSIVDDAGVCLADTVTALPSADRDAPLVVGGSVLFHQEGLRTTVTGLLRERGWGGPVLPMADGTLGAVCMNLRSAGVTVDAELHKHARISLAAIRSRS